MLPTPSPPFRAGKYELQLVAMCDCYVGCDRTLPVRIKVSAMTRAAMEGRDARSQKAQQGRRELDSDEEDDDDKGSKGGCRRRRSRRGAGDQGDAGMSRCVTRKVIICIDVWAGLGALMV